MRLLVAPGSFADLFGGLDGVPGDTPGPGLGAVQAAEAIAQGWTRQVPTDRVRRCPLSDGGPGFVEVLHAALGGELVRVTVTGPLGRPVPADVLLVSLGGSTTAYLEAAQACGLNLLASHERDPSCTSTVGVGELVARARALGAGRIVVGLGGESTNDGGAGLLAALARDSALDGSDDVRWRSGGGALAGASAADLAWLGALQQTWSDVELVGAYDVDCPLLGFHGTSATQAPGKGADPAQTQHLERALADLVEAVGRALSEPARPGGPAAVAGAGAGGGLGYAIALLGGRLTSGARLVLDAVGFDELLADCDLVVTGEGRFDWLSLRAGPVAEVAAAAAARAVPVVVVAGQVQVGRRETTAIGVDGAYPLARDAAELAAVLADPAVGLGDCLEKRAAAVARTWSLP